MSTRANIILKESYSYKDANGKNQTQTNELLFYRHSDGYPEGILPILNKFMDWLKSGKIRNDLMQCSGWLVILGAIEYGTIPEYKKDKPAFKGAKECGDINTIKEPDDWKVGAFEPTPCIYGDIMWLYTIDLNAKELTYKEV
jgi:hypothetical protein